MRRIGEMSVAEPAAPPVSGASVWGADEVPALGGARSVVLVVTQDQGLRQELVAALRGGWMVVDQAGDGLAALYALDRRAPDVVILDMDVPEVSGHRVYQVLRQDPQTRRVPVIMLASGACQEVCERPGEVASPESFLQKPVMVEEVLGALAQTGVMGAFTRN
jgi:CheY-like chemotaxis protein